MPQVTHPAYDVEVAALRAVMGNVAFDSAWSSGHHLTPRQAIDEASSANTALQTD